MKKKQEMYEELKGAISQVTETQYTCDAVLLASILLQVIERLDYMLEMWINSQHVLARTQGLDIGTTAVLVYQNPHPYPVSLRIWNTDAAQTVWISPNENATTGGIPIFPECDDKFTIDPGDNVYAQVSAGTVTIRFMLLTSWRAFS